MQAFRWCQISGVDALFVLFIKLLPFSNLAWASPWLCGCVGICERPRGTHGFARRNSSVREHDDVCASDFAPKNSTAQRMRDYRGTGFGVHRQIWGEAVIADFWALSIGLFAGVLFA